jgi:hypothetical protein
MFSKFVFYAISAVCMSSFAKGTDFVGVTVEVFGKLKNAIEGSSNRDAIKCLIIENFDMQYIVSKLCHAELTSDKVQELRDLLVDTMLGLLSGEAMGTVTKETLDAKSISVVEKKNTVFVKCKLSDDTELTIVYRKDSGKIIDIRCVGISLAKVPETIVQKYCDANNLNYKAMNLDQRVETAKQALRWHINGQG